jgi:hypothetical protein
VIEIRRAVIWRCIGCNIAIRAKICTYAPPVAVEHTVIYHNIFCEPIAAVTVDETRYLKDMVLTSDSYEH